MSEPRFKKIVIFGAGLIGGSFALALRKANAVGEVVGFGRSAATLQQARQLGILDRVGEDMAREVADADIVLLATPVGQMAELMERIAPHLGARTLVTDGGSTKGDVVRLAHRHLAAHLANFVPAHPIAGTEHSGAAAAFPELFRDRNLVLTPLAETDGKAVQRVRALWEACGAAVREMTPESHDGIFAAVSHLPHLLAFALVDEIARRPDAGELFRYAASGFRDFTRIAASHPEMWRDICLANKDALLLELDSYRAQLDELHQALAAGDGRRLEEIFDTARTARRDWAEGKR